MGILDEFKKLMFGAKSVSRSTADKVRKKGKVAGDKIKSEGEEVWESTKEKAEELGEEVREKAADKWGKARESSKEFRESLKERSMEAGEFAEDLGKVILDKTGKAAHKAEEIAEDIGEKILKKSEEVFGERSDKFDSSDEEEKDSDAYTMDDLFSDEPTSGDTDQDIPEHGQDPKEENSTTDEVEKSVSDNLVDKAKKASDRMSELLDETVEKAESLAEEESKAKKYDTPPSESLKKDLLDNDDFFKKAAAFADGRYSEVHDTEIKHPENDEDDDQDSSTSGTLPGFEDLDGDGNEIIDDALIVSDDDDEE